jgi:hypothetical protein
MIALADLTRAYRQRLLEHLAGDQVPADRRGQRGLRRGQAPGSPAVGRYSRVLLIRLIGGSRRSRAGG